METILMKLGMILIVCGIIFFYYILLTVTVNGFWQNVNDIKKNIEIRKKINKWK